MRARATLASAEWEILDANTRRPMNLRALRQKGALLAVADRGARGTTSQPRLAAGVPMWEAPPARMLRKLQLYTRTGRLNTAGQARRTRRRRGYRSMCP
jgi:hypothetical protein